MFKRRRDSDFSNEIQAHLDLEADRLVAGGMAPEEARLVARKTFGNVTAASERYHERQGGAWLDALSRNLRYAARGLARRKAFTLTAVLTLAFGIGVNSALFTLLYSMILRPPAVGDPSRMVNVFRRVDDDGRGYGLNVHGSRSSLSWPDYVRLRDGSTTLEALAVARRHGFALAAGERVVPVEGEFVSCNYFTAVRVNMSLGRSFAPDECARRGEGAVVVVSHGAWQRQFGGDSSVVGRVVTLNRHQFTIIGVAAAGYSGADFPRSDAWIPITMYPVLQPNMAHLFDADASWLTAIGRLRDDATAEAASVELTTLARGEDTNWPGRVSTMTATSGTRLKDPEQRTAVAGMVTGVVVLGLLILALCCANVMNLLLGRAAARRREIGIRLSLGASRARLVTQLMVESGLLALMGGTVGLLFAWWLPPLVLVAAPPGEEVNLVFTPDRWVLAVTAVVALGAAFIFGLLPALQSTNQQLTAAMRNDSSGSAPGPARRWRGLAVGVQVSVSALLLVIAAMFLRAAQRSFAIDPGFTIDGVSTVTFNTESLGYDSLETRQFMTAMRDRLMATPGITSVAMTQFIPLRGRGMTTVQPDGTRGTVDDGLNVLFNRVSGNYFGTVGIPLVRGRTFTDDEALARDQVPVVISEAFARLAWPTTDALGHRIAMGPTELVVIGIAKDVQSTSLGTPDGPYLYTPAHPDDLRGARFAVTAELPVADLGAAAERAAREMDPSVLVETRTFALELTRTIAPVKLAGQVASGIGAIALLLASVGVYGVAAFSVTQRSREIGIRMALGATRRSVQAMVFRQGSRVVVIGLAVGLTLAAGVSQAIRSLLFGLDALDPLAFAAVAGLLGGVAAVAVALPAARASRVDPVTSLRED